MIGKIPKIPKILKNIYVVIGLAFLIWMLFFDINDIGTMSKMRSERDELIQEKVYYKENINKIEEDIHQLRSDDKHLEKFAREKYLMHREDEDVYIVVEKEAKKKD